MNPLDKPIDTDEGDEKIDSGIHVEFMMACLAYIEAQLGRDIAVGLLRHLANLWSGPPNEIIREIDLGGLGLESIRNNPDIIDPIPRILDCLSDLGARYGKMAVNELLMQLAEQGWTLGDYEYSGSPDPDDIPGATREAMASLVKDGLLMDFWTPQTGAARGVADRLGGQEIRGKEKAAGLSRRGGGGRRGDTSPAATARNELECQAVSL